MANSSQAPDFEGIHYEMHGIAEQIRIMNKLNARLVHHLTHTPAPTTIPVLKGSNWSHNSYRSGDQGTAWNYQNASHGRSARRHRRRSPSHHSKHGRRGKCPKISCSQSFSNKTQKSTIEEDHFTRMTIPTSVTTTWQPSKSSRIWTPEEMALTLVSRQHLLWMR